MPPFSYGIYRVEAHTLSLDTE